MSFDLGKVDVYDFLTSLEARNVDKIGDEFNFSCPFDGHPHGDMKPSCYMNEYTTAWLCHGCKRRGNAVHFLARLENISPLLALRYIRERYESDFREPGDTLLREFDSMFFGDFDSEEQTTIELVNFYEVDWTDRKALSNVPKGCSDYIFGRGFRPDTLVKWGIGYCQDVDRITIPVFDQHNVLQGFKGRAWQSYHQPKYLVLGDVPGKGNYFGYPSYEKSKFVFGIDRVSSRAGVVVEGELNAIALSQKISLEDFSPVALNGSDISPSQLLQIVDNFDSLVVFFDSDVAGISGAAKVVREVMPYIPVRVVNLHDGDPADLTSEECVSLIESATPVLENLIPDAY